MNPVIIFFVGLLSYKWGSYWQTVRFLYLCDKDGTELPSLREREKELPLWLRLI